VPAQRAGWWMTTTRRSLPQCYPPQDLSRPAHAVRKVTVRDQGLQPPSPRCGDPLVRGVKQATSSWGDGRLFPDSFYPISAFIRICLRLMKFLGDGTVGVYRRLMS
jgi:hypothetical protein